MEDKEKMRSYQLFRDLKANDHISDKLNNFRPFPKLLSTAYGELWDKLYESLSKATPLPRSILVAKNNTNSFDFKRKVLKLNQTMVDDLNDYFEAERIGAFHYLEGPYLAYLTHELSHAYDFYVRGASIDSSTPERDARTTLDTEIRAWGYESNIHREIMDNLRSPDQEENNLYAGWWTIKEEMLDDPFKYNRTKGEYKNNYNAVIHRLIRYTRGSGQAPRYESQEEIKRFITANKDYLWLRIEKARKIALDNSNS